MNQFFFGISLLGSLILSSATVLMGLPGAEDWEENGWIISPAAGPLDYWERSADHWESWQGAMMNIQGRPVDQGESSPVAPLPLSGEDLYRIHREGWEYSIAERDAAYQEILAEKREIEWELLRLPARPYPKFYQWLRLDVLMPGLDRLSSQANYLFWILSGALFTAGLYSRLVESSGSTGALRAIAVTLLLIVLMGAAGAGLRWADGFVNELADGLSRLGGGGGHEGEYHHLIAILTGVETSLARSREVIWREEESPRSAERSFWTPARNLATDLIDFLLKGCYLICSWLVGLLAGLTLFMVVLLEQLRHLLLHLGYALAPVAIALWAVPGLRASALGWTRLLVAILLWPVGWVLCFHLGNLLAGPMVHSWSGTDSPTGTAAWYEPEVLGVQLWQAFLADSPWSYLSMIVGVGILCFAILAGLWLVCTRLHRLLEYGTTPWLPVIGFVSPKVPGVGRSGERTRKGAGRVPQSDRGSSESAREPTGQGGAVSRIPTRPPVMAGIAEGNYTVTLPPSSGGDWLLSTWEPLSDRMYRTRTDRKSKQSWPT